MRRHNGSNDRRSAPRMVVPLDSPVYIQRNVDGIDLSLLVENLNASGAMLICPELNDPFQPGEDFGDCILVLPGIGHAAIKAVILWAMWPKVGVQFTKLSKQARQQIDQFLNSVSQLPQNQDALTVR